jgi:hypothetical protein
MSGWGHLGCRVLLYFCDLRYLVFFDGSISPSVNDTKGAFGNHENGHYLEIMAINFPMAIIDNGWVFG